MHRFAVLLLVVGACADYARPSVGFYEAGDFANAARAADQGIAQHPDDDALWAMRVRAALALGDPAAVETAYAGYVARRGDDDQELLHGLALATLSQALASPSAKLKIAAIETIERLELQALADDVAASMGDNDDRVAATAAIAVLHAYPQAPQVADAMLHSENPEARRIVIAGLARKAGTIVTGELEKAANDPDPRVRRAAIDGLGRLKDKAAVTVLAKRMTDPDEAVRASAASALADIGIGDLAAFAKKALADQSVAVRVAGVHLLGKAEQLDQLAALENDPDPIVALEAVVTRQPRHDRPDNVDVQLMSTTPAIVQRAIASPKWEVRAGVANMLVRILGKAAATPIAEQLAKDPDTHVALAAARVLSHDAATRDQAIAVFRAQLGGELATQAAADLAALDSDPEALAKLSQLVRDPQHTAEQRADAASAHLTARKITPGLVAALADTSGVVRVEAASVLAALAKD
ncbi:MAG TPA: HEAT repeat domain-containing protein [Kofleriaceae bacterium]|nr:HEAT repeat domain-containing protein [Kofleriaceae bacterium]